MALAVVITVTFSRTQVIITDTTGAYNVSTNPGGYGSPNGAFSDYTHHAILRKKNVNSVPDSVMSLDSYNPVSATSFTATRSVDGWYEATKLTITIWTAGTYASGIVKSYGGIVYIANTSTTGTPGVSIDWTVVTDLTTIEDNTSLIATVKGRVTEYNADAYWSQQMGLLARKGQYGVGVDDRNRKRLDDIELQVNVVLVADQYGYNEEGEQAVQHLIIMGAKL